MEKKQKELREVDFQAGFAILKSERERIGSVSDENFIRLGLVKWDTGFGVVISSAWSDLKGFALAFSAVNWGESWERSGMSEEKRRRGMWEKRRVATREGCDEKGGRRRRRSRREGHERWSSWFCEERESDECTGFFWYHYSLRNRLQLQVFTRVILLTVGLSGCDGDGLYKCYIKNQRSYIYILKDIWDEDEIFLNKIKKSTPLNQFLKNNIFILYYTYFIIFIIYR